ncbi:MAG TPA: pyridoxal-phosphate dependent enzyme [Steroidobacteraceae bacterium]
MSADLPVFADVVAALGRIGPHLLRTPVVRSDAFDARCGRRVFFKCENLQRGGAFKYRGALNAVLQLRAGEATCVATHSSGNHGAALALAARARGLRAFVVMPRDSARVKIAAVERAGARVITCEPGLPAREAALAQLLQRERAHLVHPFDDVRVIAGQGTAVLELLGEVPVLDVVSAPVGGGGLIGGTALVVKTVLPRCRVIAAEPAAVDDAQRSLGSGVRASAGTTPTIADGLRASIGERGFQLLRAYVDAVVTVSETEIIAAMRIALEDLKLLIEPSAAVPLAALLQGAVGAAGERVGVIISGGNVDLDRCSFLGQGAPASGLAAARPARCQG